MSRAGLPSIDETLRSAVQVAGLHFDPDEWDALIQQHGVCATIRRSLVCPCARADTRTPAADCPTCRGLGLAYPAGLEFVAEVLLTSRTGEVQQLAAGALAHGSAACTFQSQVRPGEPLVPRPGDQIMPDGELHTVSELFITGGPPEVSDRWAQTVGPQAPPPPLARSADRLLYSDVDAVEYMGWQGPDGQLVEAELGVDFDLSGAADETRIVWRAGRAPPLGVAVSVRYRAAAAYIVHSAVPAVRVEAGARLPYKASVARLDRWAADDLR